MKHASVIISIGSCVAAACRAASGAPVPENLLACARLPDPLVRVRCYDAQIAAMTGAAEGPPTFSREPSVHTPSTAPAAPVAATPPPPASTPAAAAPVVPAAPAAMPPPKFGEEQLPSNARATPPPEEEALVSSIVAIRPIRESVYLISLANGQVWRQDGSQVTLLFRVGHEVRIERGAFGSYHMSASALGAKNWVLVKRIS
jgi:hypothetical protein